MSNRMPEKSQKLYAILSDGMSETITKQFLMVGITRGKVIYNIGAMVQKVGLQFFWDRLDGAEC